MDADVARGPADERDNAGSHECSWTRIGDELGVYGGEETRGEGRERILRGTAATAVTNTGRTDERRVGLLLWWGKERAGLPPMLFREVKRGVRIGSETRVLSNVDTAGVLPIRGARRLAAERGECGQGLSDNNRGQDCARLSTSTR
jgi:hypothetical protein